MERVKNEKGSLIVEASIVFPVMFLVIFFLIFLGNVYYQRSRAQAIMTEATIKYAACYSNPMLDYYIQNGSLPACNNANDFKPYRYIFPSDIASDIKADIEGSITQMGEGLFSDMDARSLDVSVDYNCYGIYASAKVEMSYKIQIPIKMLGQDTPYEISIDEYMEISAMEGSEMVRNISMVMDILERHGFNGFEEFINDTEDGLGRVTNFIN